MNITITSYGGRSTMTGKREVVSHVELDVADVTAGVGGDKAAVGRIDAAFIAARDAAALSITCETVIEHAGRVHALNPDLGKSAASWEMSRAIREIAGGAEVQTIDDVVRALADRPEVERVRSWKDRTYVNLAGTDRQTRTKIWLDGQGFHVRLADGEDEIAATAAELTAWVDQAGEIPRAGEWRDGVLPLAVRAVPAGSQRRW